MFGQLGLLVLQPIWVQGMVRKMKKRHKRANTASTL